jgi:hypothetical protein
MTEANRPYLFHKINEFRNDIERLWYYVSLLQRGGGGGDYQLFLYGNKYQLSVLLK